MFANLPPTIGVPHCFKHPNSAPCSTDLQGRTQHSQNTQVNNSTAYLQDTKAVDLRSEESEFGGHCELLQLEAENMKHTEDNNVA